MPLPNTSPDMSPMPTTVNSCVWRIEPELAEMALDQFPGTLGGDAHLLVVVAGRAAGREGVVQPEAVLPADPVGDSRRTWRCLCRRPPRGRGRRRRSGPRPAAGRCRRRARLSVMSSRPRRKRLVAADALVQERRPVAAGGGRLTTKPPLAPTGTITAFLTICAFIRPRTSVRKSSRRSDQRRPPRATLPPRRCTPST